MREMPFISSQPMNAYKDWLVHQITHLNVWSFDRKTYTWSSPKSSRSWNPADFMKSVKSGGFHLWNPVDFMKSGGFHPEIRRISWNPWNPVDFRWNPVDFTQISPVKSTQNYKSKVFIAKTLQFDECRVGDFTLEIHQISPWNLADFTCEIHPKL